MGSFEAGRGGFTCYGARVCLRCPIREAVSLRRYSSEVKHMREDEI